MERPCCCGHNPLKEIILPIVERNGRNPSMLIQILHETQEAMGYLPKDVQQCIADELRMPPAEVYSVVTFYSRFTMTPKGRHTISVCLGTACYVKGAEAIIEKLKKHLAIGIGQTTADGAFTLDICRCVGACNRAPVAYVDNDQHEFITPEAVLEILSRYSDDQGGPMDEAAASGSPEQEEVQL